MTCYLQISDVKITFLFVEVGKIYLNCASHCNCLPGKRNLRYCSAEARKNFVNPYSRERRTKGWKNTARKTAKPNPTLPGRDRISRSTKTIRLLSSFPRTDYKPTIPSLLQNTRPNSNKRVLVPLPSVKSTPCVRIPSVETE